MNRRLPRFFGGGFKDFIYSHVERGEGKEEREREREREKHRHARGTLIGCLSHTPNWGPGPQPRHFPDQKSN